METQYAVGGFSVKSESGRFFVFCGDKQLDSFDTYEDATNLLQDLHLSKKSSSDELIGQVKFCPAMLDNGMSVVVVAKIKDGYLVQPQGTTKRMVVAEEYLSDVPNMFDDNAQIELVADIAEAPMESMVDVRVQNEGTIVLLHPLSEGAKGWINEHLPQDAQRLGEAVAVEPRYVDDIIDGMLNDGLVVE